MAQRSRDKNKTKQLLMKAALSEFAKNGYDATTTRIIAQRAKVNEALIHRYFGSKKGLFLALRDRFRGEFMTQLLAYPESHDLSEEIFRFLQVRLVQGPSYKKFFKLWLSQALIDPSIREDLKDYAEFRPAALVQRFEKFESLGQLPKHVRVNDLISLIHVIGFSLSVLVEGIECISKQDAIKFIKKTSETLTAPRRKP